MGFELVALILSAVWLGPILDRYFGTQGVWLLVLLVSLLIGWFVRVIYLLRRISEE